MATVLLRNPRRVVEVDAPKPVKVVLRDLDIDPDSVLVIRGEDLLTREDVIEDGDEIEIRSVISGGAPTAGDRHATAALRRRPGGGDR